MLTIYHGRAQSGKTRALFAKIRAGAAEGRKQILVVPEMLSHETERRLLKECGNPIARYAEVLTFQRMAARILKETGKQVSLLDAGGRVLTMYRALRHSESGLEYFKAARMRPELVEKLMGIVDELKVCRVSPEQMMSAAGRLGVTKEKVQDLSLIYAAYERFSQGMGLDDKDLLNVAEDALRDCDFGHEWDFYFDGFLGMTAQERSFLRALLLRCRDMGVSVLWDEEPFFNEQKKLILKLKSIAEELGEETAMVELQNSGTDRPPELQHLEKELMGYRNLRLESECKAIKLCMISSPMEECEYAAAQARKAAAEGMRYREMVLATGNMEEYGPLLEQAFSRYDAPLFLAKKSDILAKPVLSAALGAIEAVTQGMLYEAVMRYLRSGLSPLSAAETDLLENYILTWDIKGREYEEPFIKNPYGFDFSREQQGKIILADIETARQKLMPPLIKLKRTLQACNNGEEYARALRSFFEESRLEGRIEEKAQQLQQNEREREAAEYRQLWEILEKGMEQFEAAMQGEAMECEEFLRLWRLMLAQYHVGTIPAKLDAVQAGSFERLSYHGAKLVMILGASDGAFPSVTLGGTLLTEQDRAELKKAGIELTQTAEEHAYEAQSHAYRAIAAAPRLQISCPQHSMDGGSVRPSYLLGRIQALLPRLQAEEPTESYRLFAKAPAFELACTAMGGGSSVEAQTARQLALEEAGAEEHLTRLHRFASLPRGPLKEQQLIRSLYGQKVRMTASRAEKLSGCRFAYFMEYGMKARPRKKARFGAPETGTFLHYVVENTIKELCTEPKADRKAIAERYMDRYLSEELNNLHGQSKRLVAIFSRLRRMVLAIIEDVWEELERSSFRPIRFEMGFGDGEENPAVIIRGGLAEIHLGGKIDRLDGYIEDGTLYLKIVDYKTGRKEFRLSDILNGINMQMFLYLIMLQSSGEALIDQAEEALGEKAEKIQTAGVLYVPAKHPFIMGQPEDSEKLAAEKQAKEVRRIGIVLDEPKVLEKLESPQNGALRFLPITYKKNGELSATSQVVSSAQFEKLTRGVRRQMEKMAAEIAKGEIEANPYSTGPQWSICQWCDFKAACQFDETMEKDRMRRIGVLKNSEVFARLDQQEEAKNGGC